MKPIALPAMAILLLAGCVGLPSDDVTTVADVMALLPASGFPQAGRPVLDAGGSVTVQIVSRVDESADVSVRFLIEGLVVHLTQLRVLPQTTTDLIGPDAAMIVEIDGTYASGAAIPPALLAYGKDFDAGANIIHYLEPPEGANVPPVVSVIEPAADVVVLRGGPLAIAWVDEDPDDNATIVAYLDTNGVALDGDEVRLGAFFAEDPDGPGNDDGVIEVPRATAPGIYRLLLVASDGRALAAAWSPGLVTVLEEEYDYPPELVILVPETLVTINKGERLPVQWTDRDDDDNAMIQFFLVPRDQPLSDAPRVLLGEPLPEDPDGKDDEAMLPTGEASPGVYTLYGTIDDGTTSMTAKAPGDVVIAAVATGASSSNPVPPISVSPNYGGFNWELTVALSEGHFEVGNTTVQLVRPGSPNIIGTNVIVAPDGESLTFDLCLDGAAAGAWNVVISTATQGSTTLGGGFTVMQRGDLNADGDVDTEDYERFFACLNGPNQAPLSTLPECHHSDLDLDDDVDLADFIFYFQKCFNGPDRPARCP